MTLTLTQFSSYFADGILLSMVVGIPAIGLYRGVKPFDAFVEGAKHGFTSVTNIFPFLIGMLVAIGMLRASGAFECLAHWLSPVLNLIGLPSEVLPLVLIRPFSGAAATGMMADIIHQHGGNAYISQLVATMMGSTETTFYVLAVYFGSVQISRTRHAIAAGLSADMAGVLASLLVCSWFLK